MLLIFTIPDNLHITYEDGRHGYHVTVNLPIHQLVQFQAILHEAV